MFAGLESCIDVEVLFHTSPAESIIHTHTCDVYELIFIPYDATCARHKPAWFTLVHYDS